MKMHPNNDKLAHESITLAEKIRDLCTKERGVSQDDATVIMNALVYCLTGLGVAVDCAPENLVEIVLEGVKEAYNKDGKYKVNAGIVKLGPKDKMPPVDSHDYTDYTSDSPFNTGRPRSKREVN